MYTVSIITGLRETDRFGSKVCGLVGHIVIFLFLFFRNSCLREIVVVSYCVNREQRV